MKKVRVLSALLAMLTLFGTLGVTAFAADEEKSAYQVMVDGIAMEVEAGATLADVTDAATFVYAVISNGEAEEIVTDLAYVLQDGVTVVTRSLSMNTQAGELRLVSHAGIRFVTAFDREDLLDLLIDERVERIIPGTLILPADLLAEGQSLTHEGLRETAHLDVGATLAKRYAEDESAFYTAGSIVDIKTQNYGRCFVGIGYIQLFLKNGETVTVYAQTHGTAIYGALAQEAVDDDSLGLSREVKRFFEEIAATVQIEGLKGLNVLAIGDSLFDGDYLAGSQQWIGLLAKECDWIFTNLGRDGWTVAYNPEAYEDPAKVRQSMYYNLFNNTGYTFGGNGSFSWGRTADVSNEEVDLILLEGGVNDYGWGLPLGTVDSEDGSTVLGAWRLIIEKLLADYPNAQIVFVTSWYVEDTKTVNGEERSRMDYVCHGIKALLEAHFADEARLSLIEAGDPAVSGIDMADPAFRNVYGKNSGDTNHLAANGMELMKKAMRPLLWEIITNKIKDVDLMC